MVKGTIEKTHLRRAAGKKSGLTGILLNTLLIAVKLTSGLLTGSMSVTADALNNLSDAAGSAFTYLGFRLAEKPADGKHPFGHARFEYLSGLTVSILIIFIGFELLKSSFRRIFHPVGISFDTLTCAILIFSVIVKAFMAVYYIRTAKMIGSDALSAAAADSRNDALMTSAVLISALLEQYARLRLDGISGLLISVFILISGVSMARKTVSPILGEAADTSVRNELCAHIEACPQVLGCHDLMVHDYGPGRTYASIHVEMDKSADPMSAHETIDKLERESLVKFGIHLVIHLDPVPVGDKETERMKKLILSILKVRDKRLDIHDFRLSNEETVKRISFDLSLPEDLAPVKDEILPSIEQALTAIDSTKYRFSITCDIKES